LDPSKATQGKKRSAKHADITHCAYLALAGKDVENVDANGATSTVLSWSGLMVFCKILFDNHTIIDGREMCIYNY